jgi:hypothetical protein
MLAGMKEAAQKKAALLTWEGYRSRLVEVVRGCLKV